jgi:hypothetical protein
MSLLAAEDFESTTAPATADAKSASPPPPVLFTPGMSALIALYAYRTARTIQFTHCGPAPTPPTPPSALTDAKLFSPHYAGYNAWQTSFGLQAPTFADSFSVAVGDEVGDYFKVRVGIEQYCQIRAQVKSELRAGPKGTRRRTESDIWFEACCLVLLPCALTYTSSSLSLFLVFLFVLCFVSDV